MSPEESSRFAGRILDDWDNAKRLFWVMEPLGEIEPADTAIVFASSSED